MNPLTYSISICANIFLPSEIRLLRDALAVKVSRSKESNSSDLPRNLLTMLVLAEDHRFFSHGGFDLIAFVRAAIKTLSGEVQGGSTIEQQLVRVITGRYERTLSRKLLEICLATTLEKQLSKSEIANLYLSIAYYGWRMTNLERATKFRRMNLASLSDSEAAILVALIKYPAPKASNRMEHHRRKLTMRVAHIERLYREAGRPNLFSRREMADEPV